MFTDDRYDSPGIVWILLLIWVLSLGVVLLAATDAGAIVTHRG